MKIPYPWLLSAALTAMGGAGLMGVAHFAGPAPWLLAGGLAVAGAQLLALTFLPVDKKWPAQFGPPRRLTIGPRDWLKALGSWAAAFHRTYAFEPGLYFTGDHYDPAAPLLVTANYHLSALLVARRARAANARLLIVDTDGINVWCSAGKGRFSAELILAELERHREALGEGRLELILPKFSLSGVQLFALRQAGLKPVIGPLYARDIPAYLAEVPRMDRVADRVDFGFGSRLFTWLPGMVQFGYFSLYLVGARALLGAGVDWPLLGLVALVATAYPLLFPWLPGRRFAVKGLWLGGALTALAAGWWLAGGLSLAALLVGGLFALATGVFFALSYTGNSAVSNYSRVRVEIARFLPVAVGLYLACAAAALIMR